MSSYLFTTPGLQGNKFYYFNIANIPAWFPQFVDVVVKLQMWDRIEEVNQLWNALMNPGRLQQQYSVSRTKFELHLPGIDLASISPFWSEVFTTEALYNQGGLHDGNQFSITSPVPMTVIYLAIQ